MRTHYLMIYPHDIQKLEIVAKNDPLMTQSLIKKDVIILITPKAYVKLLTLTQLLDHYNIENKSRVLPLKIDGYAIKSPGDIIAANNAVHAITIDKINNYISIVTKQGVTILNNKNKKGEVMIN